MSRCISPDREPFARWNCLFTLPVEWTNVFRRADELSEEHALKGGQRTIDLLHVAIALDFSATTFLSFDQRQRRLAQGGGFKSISMNFSLTKISRCNSTPRTRCAISAKNFHLPLGKDGKPVIYFAGNSLGLMPKSARQIVDDELDNWARLGVDAHHATGRRGIRTTKRCANRRRASLARNHSR